MLFFGTFLSIFHSNKIRKKGFSVDQYKNEMQNNIKLTVPLCVR